MTTATGALQPATGVAFTALVVDPHPFIREAMARRLRSLGASEVWEAATVTEARLVAAEHAGDVCILDLGFPDGSGVDLLGELKAAGWSKLVVLSAEDEPHAVRSAFVAGAQGYLLKSSSPAVVLDGVRRVLDGGVYADPALASLLVNVRSGLEPGRDLSHREIEVLQLVADGRSNKQVGELLGLSALTVKSHLARIARKLGTGDRAEMVATALRAGLIR